MSTCVYVSVCIYIYVSIYIHIHMLKTDMHMFLRTPNSIEIGAANFGQQPSRELCVLACERVACNCQHPRN